jgi:hypothetical protein
MTVISVDLAYKRHADIGIVAITRIPRGLDCQFMPPPSLSDPPEPDRLARWLIRLAEDSHAITLMLDGPQGWKDPANGLVHSRVCERALNAPAKTGLRGIVKPANYLQFVSFSVAVFDALAALGWQRLASFPANAPSASPVAVESLPLSAWRSLGIPILPAKTRARAAHISDRLSQLCQVRALVLSTDVPTHDQLQALVSGIGAESFSAGEVARIAVAGMPPTSTSGVWCEGYIINPVP